MMAIEPLGPEDDPSVRRLLMECGLPVADLDEARPVMFGDRDGLELRGVVGVELHGESGLLRSLAVRPDARGGGLGDSLVRKGEQFARSKGVRRLYLLTDTAEPFFARRGYALGQRSTAPAAIRGTSEFSTICPTTSRFMVKTLDGPPWRVLLLCTGNSARSQIAEALLSVRGGDRFEVTSAGSKPASRVNPLAVRVLADAGIPWEGRSPRGLEGIEGQRWDFVITVCDRAREACPIFPGTPVLAHWGMPDPAEVEGGEEEKLRAFRDTLVTLRRRIDLLLALPLDKLDRMRIESEIRAIGRDSDSPA